MTAEVIHLRTVPAGPSPIPVSRIRQAAARMRAELGAPSTPVDPYTERASVAFVVLHLQAQGAHVDLGDATPAELHAIGEMQRRIGVSSAGGAA